MDGVGKRSHGNAVGVRRIACWIGVVTIIYRKLQIYRCTIFTYCHDYPNGTFLVDSKRLPAGANEHLLRQLRNLLVKLFIIRESPPRRLICFG